MTDSYFGAATGIPTATGRIIRTEVDLPDLDLAPGLKCHALVGERMLASFVRYEPNSIAPLHAHEEEQIFICVEGELEITLGEEVRRVGPGDAALIPPWVSHTVRSFDAPAFQIDVFSPPRKAMLELLEGRPPA